MRCRLKGRWQRSLDRQTTRGFSEARACLASKTEFSSGLRFNPARAPRPFAEKLAHWPGSRSPAPADRGVNLALSAAIGVNSGKFRSHRTPPGSPLARIRFTSSGGIRHPRPNRFAWIRSCRIARRTDSGCQLIAAAKVSVVMPAVCGIDPVCKVVSRFMSQSN